MTPRIRKFAFTAQVTFSVGWLGAVVAYLALAIASLLSGLVQSLGTEWGLFRHYWILAKFLLTIVGTAILLGHMQTVSRMAAHLFAGILTG